MLETIIHTFTVNTEEQDEIDVWLKNVVYPYYIREQKEHWTENPEEIKYVKKYVEERWSQNLPYEGVEGGGLIYMFRPNNIGVALFVKYGKFELDLTHLYDW